jgi:hypothetical protein
MASTTQNTTTATSNQAGNTAQTNESVKSIADALAALPKEQTMKDFLEQQSANAKNMNDKLVEQFGSAIDNSDIAESLNEVRDAFRKKEANQEQNAESEKQAEHFAKIQNDLDRILEIQGEALKADVKRDEAMFNDMALKEVEEKDDEKVDENTDVVKEDVKPVEVKVDVQLPEMDTEPDKVEREADAPSKEETLLNDIVSAQTEQNSLLSDIGQKLSDANLDEPSPEDKPDEPSPEETLLKDIVSAQTEQNVLLNDIGQKLTDTEENEANVDTTPDEPSKEETLLGDIAAAQTEQNSLLNDIGQKLTEPDDVDVPQPDVEPNDVPSVTETAVAEVNENLGKINDSIDNMLDELGESLANTDVNEPQPMKVPEETEPEKQSVELAEDSLNSIRELVDTAKQNEMEVIESMKKQDAVNNEDTEPSLSDSITELANDISGATDAMNNQDETPLESHEEQVAPEDSKRLDQAAADKNVQFDEETNRATSLEEEPQVLDARMDMEARAERDITPALNEIQMFNRMSLTKEEIQVLAAEIGKSVAENMRDTDADKKRDAAYLDEVERIVRG